LATKKRLEQVKLKSQACNIHVMDRSIILATTPWFRWS